MSTKTSFKRIALVAVAALGFGMLSVVPSSAGQDLSNISIVSSDTTGSVGTPVSATVNMNYVAVGSDNIATFGASFYGAPSTSSLSTPGGSLQWSVPTDTSSAVNNNNALTYQASSASWAGSPTPNRVSSNCRFATKSCRFKLMVARAETFEY